MKLLRVGRRGYEVPAVSLDEHTALDLSGALGDGIDRLITDEGLAVARAALADPTSYPRLDLRTERIGSPLAAPGKVVCVGLNYKKHAAETHQAEPTEPILFLKTPYTVQGPSDDVWIPRTSVKTDYEVELAIVIGRAARYLDSPEVALEHVLGYAISDDVSEREFQTERGGQWDKGKNCETFNPFGPWIVTADAVPDPDSLALGLSVNGEVRQRSSTADMIFSVPYLVWYISQFMALLPGDVINTGTPEGVGMGFQPPKYLSHGDEVSVWIEGLGDQTHRFFDYDRRFSGDVSA
jgi:2-keto-4-pentenoate hydratase/2-oxohepta-3-ene-1,7-dioic acid hydratase in catechol pathway